MSEAPGQEAGNRSKFCPLLQKKQRTKQGEATTLAKCLGAKCAWYVLDADPAFGQCAIHNLGQMTVYGHGLTVFPVDAEG